MNTINHQTIGSVSDVEASTGSIVEHHFHAVLPFPARPISRYNFRYLDVGLRYLYGSTRTD